MKGVSLPKNFISMVTIKGRQKPIPYITEAANGMNSWKNSSFLTPCRYFVNDPDAAITNINVVYIQKGPYRSGLC